jgi:hypothetical protein
LPFPWTFAVYQNFTVLGATDLDHPVPLVKRAIRQAGLWPSQNIYLHLIGAGFALVVFANWATVLFLVPYLLKTLLGVETIFSRSGWALLNTTFFAATLGLTYLSIDPIIKSAYALRCFYGQALESGADLKAELRRLCRPAAAAALAVMCACCLLPEIATAANHVTNHPSVQEMVLRAAQPDFGGEAQTAPRKPAQERESQETSVQGSPIGLDSTTVRGRELEGAIQSVLSQRKYAWRMPRESAPKKESEPGLIARFFADLGETIRKTLVGAIEWIGDIFRKLFQPRWRLNPSNPGYGWIVSLQLLLYVLLAAALAGLVYLIYRYWRGKRSAGAVIVSQPVRSTLDLTQDHVAADELPEDGWAQMARELAERGEFRLALRAWYLASLAYLANCQLITLAQFKSNLEYERELRRRAHALPRLLSLFDENLAVLERVWYGRHAVDAQEVRRFTANLEQMKTAHSTGGVS